MLRIKKILKMVLIIVFICGIGLSCIACSDISKYDTIGLKAFYSENVINLPIKAKSVSMGANASGYIIFSSKQTLDELNSIIDEGVADVDTSMYKADKDLTYSGDAITITKNNGNGTKDYYSIICYSRAKDNYGYIFTSMRNKIIYANDNNEKESFDMLLPLHYMYKYEVNRSDSKYMTVEYPTTATLDDLYEFYLDSGWLNVEKNTDSILIKGYKGGLEVKTDDASPQFNYRIVVRKYLDMNLFRIEKG